MVSQNSELHPVLNVVMEVTVKLGERGVFQNLEIKFLTF